MAIKIYRPSAEDLALGIDVHPGYCQADIGQTIGFQCLNRHMRYPSDYTGIRLCKRHARQRRLHGIRQ